MNKYLSALLLAALPLFGAGNVTTYPLPTNASSPSGTVFTADGAVWVSNVDGLYRLDRRSGTFTRITDVYVRSLVLGADGALWAERDFGSGSALLRFDPQDGSSRQVRQFAGEGIWTLAAGHDGLLWIVLQNRPANTYRLVRVNMAGEIVSSVAIPSATPSTYYPEDTARHVVTTHGLWWVEVITGGLRLLTPAGQVHSYPLPFNEAYWLAAGGDFLWIANVNGRVARIGFDGAVLAEYDAGRRISAAEADAEGDLWLREPDRLSEFTRDGVYVTHERLPPPPCPNDTDFSRIAFSTAGEIAVTDALGRLAVPVPQPCLEEPGAIDSVTIVLPAHGLPHEIPAAGTTALVVLTILIGLIAVRLLRP